MNYNWFSFFFSLIIYPPVAHWCWDPNGWLAKLGMIDFAGSAVVHIVGGTAALVGAMLCGPRTGRFREVDGKRESVDQTVAHPGHSVLGKRVLLLRRVTNFISLV
jgi:Amt family ammonium transporter